MKHLSSATINNIIVPENINHNIRQENIIAICWINEVVKV